MSNTPAPGQHCNAPHAQIFHHVPNARPAEIDDDLLNKLKQVALDAQHSLASKDSAELMVYCLPALIEELLQRRAAMSLIGTVLTADNITVLPTQRG
jgi:hypothetical protein